MARDDAACRAGRLVYDLQFAYPPEPEPVATPIGPPTPADGPATSATPAAPDDLPPPAARNTAYTFTGAVANVPMRAFDDGRSTWLRWADGVPAPAVYALGPDKSESLLNYVVKGDYVVVDAVSPAFVLRRGSAVAVLYNDAYQQPKLDIDAPRPRGQAVAAPAKPSGLARLFGSAASTQETPR
jgi:type IV secretion system protein VirB9